MTMRDEPFTEWSIKLAIRAVLWGGDVTQHFSHQGRDWGAFRPGQRDVGGVRPFPGGSGLSLGWGTPG